MGTINPPTITYDASEDDIHRHVMSLLEAGNQVLLIFPVYLECALTIGLERAVSFLSKANPTTLVIKSCRDEVLLYKTPPYEYHVVFVEHNEHLLLSEMVHLLNILHGIPTDMFVKKKR